MLTIKDKFESMLVAKSLGFKNWRTTLHPCCSFEIRPTFYCILGTDHCFFIFGFALFLLSLSPVTDDLQYLCTLLLQEYDRHRQAGKKNACLPPSHR